MNKIKLRAMAKINLGLDVVKRREDGYHEVRMIMQTIKMYDKITIRKRDDNEIKVKTNLYYLPTDENNLVYKAAKLILEKYEVGQGVEITLEKFIPVAAGMAGGSSDAAAVLYGINKIFKLRATKNELMELGVKIGADVPYCIMRGTALAEGIGEKLTPLKAVPKTTILIAKPSFGVSTKFVYENLVLDENTPHPDIDGIIDSINEGDIYSLSDRIGNVLETVTAKEYPQIEEIKNIMKQNGALNALMSGSGPTVFGIFDNKEDANRCKQLLKGKLVKQVFVTETFN
ncbi:MAG: 4-(cytidine 5'-diphospho)-2-C-methyl-D-erythritol kinase [Lachnospiraceae bacterium]|uniref:4-(cytidine 5'-diphospho)-2-C-methyl-D-erythritol kinase n=1 Tax=Falcatimonas sp. MSJ-15 TaxID=2841515 RepID=UPI001C0F43C7|nr:4-(cytidine 5'-diphospho)-2-C-methyl-D-erythritol kinase [Falcatimonas sp. MSJ-15]MBQ5734194.1 4-(cytidine 5'-diphospho)-2-C-methyl-D-erythritol kinase [Lachnospiraceae bacterium]MBU5471088.1 4-(cytidine 5'-diphospho)-2-C-methyl-D-erythritol kinase [Falcatimonas sp. MSJ-15]MEE0959102.1 4-(cytidine 5'-diphospho)-2-C-methyl-D-erythritol kinase [Lachnospiraceae bacterium]